MKHSRLLISLLLLAIVLVDAAAYCAAAGTQFPKAATMLLNSLAYSQVSLLAVWVGLASKRTPWPVLGAVVAVASWSWLASSISDTSFYGFRFHTTVWTLLLLTQTILVAVPLSIARLAGVRVVNRARAAEGQEHKDLVGPRQFSLANLLGWMTALALVLSIVSYVLHRDQLAPARDLYRLRDLLNLAITTTGDAVLSWGALWAVFGARPAWIRTSVLAVAVTAVSIAGIFGNSYFYTLPTEYIAYCTIQTLFLVGPLLVFRVAGYRIGISGREPAAHSTAGKPGG